MLINNAYMLSGGQRYPLYWRNGKLWVNPWSLGYDPRRVYIHDGKATFFRYGRRRYGVIRIKAGRA